MSHPDGDQSFHMPTHPADSSATPEPSSDTGARSAGPAALPPTPRANPPSVFNPKDVPAPTATPEPGYNDFLNWVQTHAGEQTPAPATATASRTLLPKEQKKFHRAEPEPKTDEKMGSFDSIAPSGAGATTAVGGPGHTVSGGAPSATAPVIRKRRKASAGTSSESHRRWLLPALLVGLLLYGDFKLGRSTAPKPAPVAVGPIAKTPVNKEGVLTARDVDLIDEAMKAESAGDFRAAVDSLEQVRSSGAHVAGLNYHLALLAFERDDLPRAMTLLDHCIDEGDESAASYNLRGTLTNRVDGINRGLDNLETATRIDPFNASYFFYLGEALRRAGKPQLALARLGEAVDRLREPALEGLYNLKVRLTLIELGREREFEDLLANELQRTPPPIDWLFTAAALEMHRGHFDAAAALLDKTMTLADRPTINLRLRDFYFVGFAGEKSLARFFPGHKPVAETRPPPDPVTAANSITVLEPLVPTATASPPTPGIPSKP